MNAITMAIGQNAGLWQLQNRIAQKGTITKGYCSKQYLT